MFKHALILCLLLSPCIALAQAKLGDELLVTPAPEQFKVKFETTKGDFTVQVNRNWAPLAADRFYQLVISDFLKDIALFRVQLDYVVQFGISDHEKINTFWDDHPLDDEAVKHSNLKGTLSYARDGAKTRTTQLFINYKDNPKLDTIEFNGLKGFPPFAEVIDGMTVVESFYGKYGFEPAEYQDSITHYGNVWLLENYPGIDYILKVELMD